jgi:hypothetical protein
MPVAIPFPNAFYVLFDHTTSATPDTMRPAAQFQAMIDAWDEQLSGPVASAYGAQSVAFRIASGPDDRQPTEIGIHFRDTIPEAPGALAYHQVVGGVPDIEIGVDLFSSLTGDGEAVSSGGSHELIEDYVDRGANGWKEKQDGSGAMGADEAADPVQNTGYAASNGVFVSNFVLPSYFIPGAPGPWDYLGVMAAQNDLSHGYEIQALAPTQVTQAPDKPRRGEMLHADKVVFTVGVELSETQRKRKALPTSRTYRRGARL